MGRFANQLEDSLSTKTKCTTARKIIELADFTPSCRSAWSLVRRIRSKIKRSCHPRFPETGVTDITNNSSALMCSASFQEHKFTLVYNQNVKSIVESSIGRSISNSASVSSLAQPQIRKVTRFTSLFIDQSAVSALCPPPLKMRDKQ